MGNLERLQKVIASTGLASRRKAERLILEGAVTVNGKLTTALGTKVDSERDAIKVNGKLIMPSIVEHVYIAFYKPMGVLSAFEDTEGRPTMTEYLHKIPQRIHPVGRLNFTSEGLLLLTNDGDWLDVINRSRNLSRQYKLKVKGHHDANDLGKFKRGIFTQEGVIRFKTVELEEELRAKSWLTLEVIEGAQLDLRETLNHRGFKVDRIIRSGIGSITTEGLNAGEWRELKKAEVEAIRNEAKVAAKERPAFKKATIVVKTKQTSSRGEMYRKDQRDTRRAPRFSRDSEDRDGFQSRRPSRDSFGSRDARPSREGRPSRDGFSSRPSRPSRDRDSFSSRDSFGSRDSRPPREGRPSRDGFSSRDSFSSRPSRPSRDRDSFSSRESFGSRDSRPPREGRPPRDGFSSRPSRPSNDRDSFSSRDSRPPRSDRPSRDRFSSGEGRPSRGGGFSGGRSSRDGFSSREGRPSRDGRMSRERPGASRGGRPSRY